MSIYICTPFCIRSHVGALRNGRKQSAADSLLPTLCDICGLLGEDRDLTEVDSLVNKLV